MSSAGMEDNSAGSPSKKKRLSLDSGASVSQKISVFREQKESNAVQEIDDGLYSRQLYVLGYEAMRRMASCDILISGLGGLGVEIAKNVILSGVKSATLHDDTQCTVADLTTQFYLTESDIGKNRADASLKQLSDLNRYVPTNSYTGQLTDDVIKKFRVVVLTNSSPEERLRISEVTHANNIALIIADTRGLFAQVFCDFGESFTVADTNGEKPASAGIESITRGPNGVVTTPNTMFQYAPHNLADGDYVTFSEIEGMTELNDCQPRKVTVIEPFKFGIGDTSRFSQYTSGGRFSQVKVPKVIHFKRLSEALQKPEYLSTVVAKSDRPPQLHLAFATLHKFVAEHGALPRLWNKADARKFISLAESLNSDGIKLDVSLLETFAKISRGSLGPIHATIGGIVAQEVIKACSGKCSPIYQWLYFDALECLPTDLEEIKEEDCQPTGSRYDGQTAIFGTTFQDKLGALKYFVVGAGAVGCELLKNFAMMGVGEGESGQVTVTDMDLVEKNRQFLFRPADVQRSKSGTAASAVRRMNPAMNVVSHENRVGSELEHLYDETFFETLDGVVNTVDEPSARCYLDRRCVYYRKPLLSMSTFGAKGITQAVVPYLTESIETWPYTLGKHEDFSSTKNVPWDFEHTRQWARDCFDCSFRQPAAIAVQFLDDREFVDRLEKLSANKPVEVLTTIKLALVDQRPSSIQDCVAWARCYWQEQFSNHIRQLLVNFPANHLTTSSGQPFWLSPKQCPVALEFSSDDPVHLDFVVAAANLKAEVYGIEQERDRERIAQMLQQMSVSEFDPRASGENTQKIAGNAEVDHYEQLKSEIPSQELFKDLHIKPIDFKMETNLHKDFIVACSNLRAANYKFPPTPDFMFDEFFDSIIPATATTSSVVAGLVCLELLKMAQGHKKLHQYKNCSVNLALPSLDYFETIAAPKVNFEGTELTFWDHLVIRGEMTLHDFLLYFEDKFDLRIAYITQGRFALYKFHMPQHEISERLGLTMSKLWERATEKQLQPDSRSLELLVDGWDAHNCQVQFPLVRYTIWARREGPC